MITIAFDEFGQFEEGERDINTISLVAGFLYDDKDLHDEKENELKRIQAYLSGICEEVEAKYPLDLHYNSASGANRSKKVSNLFNETIHEFLTKGTYKSAELDGGKRQGQYWPFAYVKTRDGKVEYLASNSSKSSDDDLLSNLYVHMVNDTINRMIFCNPYIERIQKVYFDLPTRSYVREKGTMIGEIKTRYKEQGYTVDTKEKMDGEGENEIVRITDNVSFRAAIEREVFHARRSDLDIVNINVRSMQYRGTKKRIREGGFQYLSDLFCDVIHKGVSQDEIMKITDRMKELTGSIGMVFYYDDMDTIYAEALEAFRKKNYYDTLEHIYEGFQKESVCRNFYVECWFEHLLRMVAQNIISPEFWLMVNKLQRDSLSNKVEQQKLVFLAEQFENIRNGLMFETDDEKSKLYEYFQTLATIYNHVANTKMSEKYISKAREYEEYISFEQRLALANKEAVALCDDLEFEKAVLAARKAQKAWDTILEVRRELYGSKDISLAARKAYSQLGQVYSFAGDPRAEVAFLQSIGEGQSANNMISMSYLLHYYLEQGMKKKYDRYATKYFGGFESHDTQLEYIVKEGTKEKDPLLNLKFALYVYVKGIYVFHVDEVMSDPGLFRKITSIDKIIEDVSGKNRKYLTGHPWEIIYKYMALISLKCGEYQDAKRFILKTESIISDKKGSVEPLLRAIVANGKLEYLEAKGETITGTKCKNAMEECWAEICNINKNTKRIYSEPGQRTVSNLRMLMTYMYH